MNNDWEISFVQAFVRRERRERTLFELVSTKKRGVFLSRLCHTYEDVLDLRYLKPITETTSSYQTILRMLKQKQAPESCYVLSSIAEIDGKQLPLSAALERVVGFGLPSIIICKPGILSYFEAEQEYDAPPRYWLERV